MYYSNLEPSWIKKGLNPKQINTTFDQHLSEKNHEYFLIFQNNLPSTLFLNPGWVPCISWTDGCSSGWRTICGFSYVNKLKVHSEL